MRIVPKPQSIKICEGYFRFSAATALEGASKRVAEELFFLDFESADKNSIRFEKCQIDCEYSIEIGDDIIVRSNSDEGFFHAAMTLKQLIFEGYEDGVSKLQKCAIKDSPKFEYRGFMVDVSRHFFDVATLKRIIDALSLVKINKLHWHLSDDQGYRIESEKFPLLNSIGGERKSTLGDGVPVKGWYTKAEIAEIVEYCAERYIEVIPEIDLPGHSLALLASYPNLGCRGEGYKVREHFGIDKRVLCAGNEDVYKFVYELIDEVSAMFPSKYFHIGGDEVPKSEWKACEKCQNTMKKHGLNNEEELQGYFTNKVINHLKSIGKVAIVWNETLKSKKLDESATVQYWQEMPRPIKVRAAVENGRKVIVSKVMEYYLDYCYGMTSLKRTYKFDPLSQFDGIDAKSVIGVESTLWTEWIADEKKLFEQAFPRAFAMAESGWSMGEKNYKDFADRLDSVLGIMQAYDLDYAAASEWNPNPIKACWQTIKFLAIATAPKNLRGD